MAEYYRRILMADVDTDVWSFHRSIEMAIQINSESIPIEMHVAQPDVSSEFSSIPEIEASPAGGCLSQFYHYGHATVQIFTFSEGMRQKNRGTVRVQFISSVKATVPTDRIVDQFKRVFPQLKEMSPWRPKSIQELREQE